MDKKNAKDLYERRQSDFISSMAEGFSVNDFEGLWNVYKQYVSQLKKLLSSFKTAGATIMTDFGCEDLSEIASYDAVILIAHHSRSSDAIELCDGFVTTSELICAIPAGYSGILDLSSCFSASFQLEMKMHAPLCRIIATDAETSLRVRIIIYEQMLKRLTRCSEDYIAVFRNVVNDLLNSSTGESIGDKVAVHLGGQQQSTIYAPASVCVGDTFIVQMFLHKKEDSEDIELQARMVDDAAQIRNTKPLSIRLKKGDKIDVSLQSRSGNKEFVIPTSRLSMIWQNEPCSVEFTVTVKENCTQSAFVGVVLIAVNKIPAGSMAFKTNISETERSDNCAFIECNAYDKGREMMEARDSLRDKMNRFLENQRNDDNMSQREMCELCLRLLTEDLHKERNPIPKVFISSTSDMAEYRKVLEERIRACEMFPDMYEMWGQGEEYPRDMCCRHVLQSDFFVCLLGSRYGFVEPIWDKSMTEIEYLVAKSSGIPILIYILNDDAEIEPRQEIFINEIKTKITVGMFKDSMALALMANSELLTLKYTRR